MAVTVISDIQIKNDTAGIVTAASRVSIADAGSDFTATTVEGALDELQADNEAHAALTHHTGGFVKMVIARWHIDGLLYVDASNHQGPVCPLPDYATAALLVEGEAVFGGLAVAAAGAAVTFDIKHSATYEGARTSIFSAVPSIAAGDVHTGDASSNDGTIDLTPTDYTAVDGGFYWLYITQVGSTANSDGTTLTVTVTAKVYVE